MKEKGNETNYIDSRLFVSDKWGVNKYLHTY